MIRATTILVSGFMGLVATTGSFAQGRPASAVKDHRMVWLVDSERGCVPGPLPRVVWQLAQQRPALRIAVSSATDHGVTIFRVLYTGRRTPVKGASYYVSSEQYCYNNYSAMVADMTRVEAGGAAAFRSSLKFRDENEYFFPGYYGK